MEFPTQQIMTFRLFRNKFALILLVTSLASYFGFQKILSINSSFTTKTVASSICKMVEFNLQTGDLRGALDYSGASLAGLPAKPVWHILLEDESTKFGVGNVVVHGDTFVCGILGKPGTKLTLKVARRDINQNFFEVLIFAILFSTFLLGGGRWIQFKTQEFSLILFEREFAQNFGFEGPPNDKGALLSKFFDLSQSAQFKKARKDFIELKARVDLQNEELKRQSVKAELGEILAHVAHDMRSPLSIISLLLSKGESAERSDLMKKALKRLNGLADEVLKTRRSLIDGSIETCELRETIAEVTSTIRLTKGKNIRIENRAEPMRLKMSATELSRVLTILLENSVDVLIDGGSISVSSQKADENLSLIVEDSGSGFPDSIVSSRPEGWRSTKVTGNGLGLKYIAKWTSSRRGRLKLSNSQYGGARVSIELPLTNIVIPT